VGLLYGRKSGREKEEIMAQMKENKIQILVATSVVEVGIDIPNATIMMVDGADRFGLAQLHQFRGRVGRSEHQSYSFLLTDSSSTSVLNRLNILQETGNGFELAEYDLKFRGAGDMYGVRQSGMPDIVMQSLGNMELVEKTRKAANDILDKDIALAKWPALKLKTEKVQKTMHFE
jgi:ATP-dependent DNA helicase RecG